MRDHGGNLDQARARFGGAAAEWIDLSTGINRVCWPVPALPPDCWTALPQAGRQGDLIEAARAAYGTQAPVLPVAGAQAAIQMLPQILPRGSARVLAPTYNEHAACLRAAGWQVQREDFTLRTDDQVAYFEYLRAGCGIGFFQAEVARRTEGVEEIPLGIPVPPLPVWIAAHEKVRRIPRVDLVWRMLEGGLAPFLQRG